MTTKRGVRQAQKAATRTKILLNAKALFERDGYEATTIRGLAAAVNMSTGAVFANFVDKAQLYREVYGHDPLTPEQGRELLHAVQEFAHHYKQGQVASYAVGLILDASEKHRNPVSPAKAA